MAAGESSNGRGYPDPLDELRALPLPEWQEQGSYRDIRSEVGDGIARLTICRPEVHNAYRPQTLDELNDVFNTARDDPDVGTIILRGERRSGSCAVNTTPRRRSTGAS